MSYRQSNGVSSIFSADVDPSKRAQPLGFTWGGLVRGLLLPAPEKHNENNSLSTTGSPQQGTMAGTAIPTAHKMIIPASSHHRI